MDRHAQDVARLCDELKLGKTAFVGVSIGGYILFEFWRRFRERVGALILSNTRAQADSDEAREARYKSIKDVQQRGPAPFIEANLQRLLGQTTLRNRLDVIENARALMSRMSVQGIVAALEGLAARPDSTSTLKTITVPTLAISGDEDILTPTAEADLIARNVPGCRLGVVPKAGHYAALEQPEYFGRLLRNWVDSVRF
jgi:pimeloyl-ACP methyl ester carboxylesterase